MTESAEQIALLQWASLVSHNGRKIGSLLFAIPNEGSRSKAHGARLKAQGLRAGVPDLMFAWPTDTAPGLFIEMKAKKGQVSEHQKKWLARLREAGYRAEVCYGMEEAKNLILEYLGAEL